MATAVTMGAIYVPRNQSFTLRNIPMSRGDMGPGHPPLTAPTCRKKMSATDKKHSLSGGLKTAISLGKTIASSGSLALLEDGEFSEVENHSYHMLGAIFNLWHQKLMCDTVIKIENLKFLAHKIVLASCSDYFYDTILRHCNFQTVDRDGRTEITITEVSSASFHSILDFMYSGRIYIDHQNIGQILDAASKLKVIPIVHLCGDFLVKQLNKDNCLRMASIASAYDMTEIEESAIDLAAEHFMEISATYDFLELNEGQISRIFERDDLRADSELDVFYRLMDWLRHDLSSRTKKAPELLKMVRLPLLTPSVIVDHVECSPLLSNVPECQELIKEALHYHCLPARQSILQSSRTTPRSKEQFMCLVAIGGAPRLKSQPVSRDVNYLDPLDKKWYRLTSLNEPRHHHAVAVVGGFIYVAGGEMTNDQRSPLNTVYRYDPRTDIWLQVASMRHQRESFQLAVLNGFLYAIGGRVNENKSLAEVECYNPAVDTWTKVASLSSPRRSIAVASYNGRIYAMGGSGEGKICSKVERYNPLVNKWESKRPLKVPRFFGLLAPVKNKLFLFGGATLDSTGNVICAQTVECYTPLNDTWCTVSPMLDPRAEAGMAVLENNIYVVGGYSWDKAARLPTVEKYDVSLNTWQTSTDIDMPLTGVGCCSVKLYGRKLLSDVVLETKKDDTQQKKTMMKMEIKAGKCKEPAKNMDQNSLKLKPVLLPVSQFGNKSINSKMKENPPLIKSESTIRSTPNSKASSHFLSEGSTFSSSTSTDTSSSFGNSVYSETSELENTESMLDNVIVKNASAPVVSLANSLAIRTGESEPKLKPVTRNTEDT